MSYHYTGEIVKQEYRGFEIHIEIHQDTDMGPPWKEHDGHGIVSEWTQRDKQSGERVLSEARRSKRFYDFAGTVKKAKMEGWGLSDAEKSKLAASLSKDPATLTRGEITARAVELDFEHLKGWCNDEWTWQGYTAELWHNGEKHSDLSASCWGFEGTPDGMEYMLSEAMGECKAEVDEMEETASGILAAVCAE